MSGVQHLVYQMISEFKKIDILIPNAGILKDLEGTTEDDFDNSYSINVKGPYLLVHVCLPVVLYDSVHELMSE